LPRGSTSHISGELPLKSRNALSASGRTYPTPIEHCSICNWQSHCEKQLREDDDLSLVAGLTGPYSHVSVTRSRPVARSFFAQTFFARDMTKRWRNTSVIAIDATGSSA
jgi:hypothetical protein